MKSLSRLGVYGTTGRPFYQCAQKLAKDGWGTVQNEQQFTSQLHQQEATVQTAIENLNQVQRQAVKKVLNTGVSMTPGAIAFTRIL